MVTVKVKGRTVAAPEWLSWREQGLNNDEIAALLGVSPATTRAVARKFRQAGIPDPQYRRRKPGPVRALDVATDAGAYVLGILWGTFSVSGDGYWVRHRDKWFVDVVKRYLEITADGYESYSSTGDQYRLKITRAVDVVTVKAILEPHGWKPRKTPERSYPRGPLDDRGFIRAWVELHSSAGMARTGRRKISVPRLRIYGSKLLLEGINQTIADGTGLSLRKVQPITTETGKTWCLYYTGKSFRAVVDWLYAGAKLYNPEVREKLKSVLNQF